MSAGGLAGRALRAMGLLALACVAGGAEPPAVLRLEQATMTATVGGHRIGPQSLTLPLHWDVEWPGQSGRADLTLAFDAAPDAATGREPYALLVPRLGNAYEVELNGVLLGSAGSMALHGDRWSAKHPVVLSFPARLLAPRNRLRFSVRADAGYRGGLSTVLLGPAAAVMPLARQAEWWRVVVPQATAVFSIFVAGFCLLLWWQQRDALYAWAALGESLWAVTVADTVIETSPLPWPYWGLVLLLLRAVWSWAQYCIAEQVFGRRPGAERWAMAGVQAATPLFVLAMAALGSTEPLKVWYAATFLVWSWVVVRLAAQTWRSPSSERALVATALAAVYLASLRDAVAGRWERELYDESAWAKYVAALGGAALMWIVSRRFMAARAEASRLQASLAQRVDDKERELRASFQRIGEVERAHAVLAERERILRDMHDGVGSHLAAAVRQLEGGRATQGEILETLRDSMEHLKLSIDALGLPRGDINALLASLRYRLQTRIESAGLRLEWDVAALPLWPQAGDETMRHLQFLLLEAISNTLQHAGASALRVEAGLVESGIVIVVEDDGRGLPAGAATPPRSLEARASRACVRIDVANGRSGTRVAITLPMARPPA